VELPEVIDSALKFLSNEWRGQGGNPPELPKGLAVRGNHNKLLQVFVKPAAELAGRVKNEGLCGRETGDLDPGRGGDGPMRGDRPRQREGMEAGTINKVFDPFFTTKDVGEGMGLGLTICHRIVREYEGPDFRPQRARKFSEFKLEFPGPKMRLIIREITDCERAVSNAQDYKKFAILYVDDERSR